MVRNYILSVVARGSLTEAKLQEVEKTITNLVKKHDGQSKLTTPFLKRGLAYDIKKEGEGYLGIFSLKLPASSVYPVRDSLTHDDNILRFLLLTQDQVKEVKSF